MAHDQMTLFAAPVMLSEPLPARRSPVRKSAHGATSNRAASCQAAQAKHADETSSDKLADLPPTPLFAIVAPMTASPTPLLSDSAAESAADLPADAIRSDRLWQLNGWTARVIKNQDDDGWAVEMLKDGEAEPALVSPWTMGRDKKNPKPLDQAAFNTLVKTANEVLQRHAQQAHAMLHRRLTVFALDAQWEVRLDITPDEYEPHATLSAFDEAGDEVAQIRVPADFRLNTSSARAWIHSGFARPAGCEDFDL